MRAAGVEGAHGDRAAAEERHLARTGLDVATIVQVEPVDVLSVAVEIQQAVGVDRYVGAGIHAAGLKPPRRSG